MSGASGGGTGSFGARFWLPAPSAHELLATEFAEASEHTEYLSGV